MYTCLCAYAYACVRTRTLGHARVPAGRLACGVLFRRLSPMDRSVFGPMHAYLRVAKGDPKEGVLNIGQHGGANM